MYQNCLKRFLAIVLSLLGIVCLGWLLLLLSFAIKLDSPAPCCSDRSGSDAARAISIF